MFIGHYAPAFVARTMKRSPSLATLFVAAQLVDIAFFSFIPLGIEKMRLMPGITATNPMDLYYMPWTHSLLGSLAFGVGMAVVIWAMARNRSAAIIAGAVVPSHWLLDLLVHRPDLTITGSPPKLGMGLWNMPAIEMPLEIALVLGSAWLYARARPEVPRGRIGGLVGLLIVLQLYNWFGPAPTEINAAFWGLALFAYALVAGVAWWVERGTTARA